MSISLLEVAKPSCLNQRMGLLKRHVIPSGDGKRRVHYETLQNCWGGLCPQDLIQKNILQGSLGVVKVNGNARFFILRNDETLEAADAIQHGGEIFKLMKHRAHKIFGFAFVWGFPIHSMHLEKETRQ